MEFALERKRRVRPPRKVIFVRVRGSKSLGLLPGPARTEALDPMLAEKVVELGWVERVSVMTVQRTDAAASSEEFHPAPGSAHSVACMEDVLSMRPYDPRRPVVCTSS